MSPNNQQSNNHTGILPCAEDFATALEGWGLLPGALNGTTAVWEADDTAALAAWPSEFAEVAAEAACDPVGGEGEAGPLQRAAATAADEAGLAPPLPPGVAPGVRSGGGRGSGSSSWAKMAAAAADAVRASHGQLVGVSGAAAALTNALVAQWQIHNKWRASRVALAGALSLQRCGLDLLLTPNGSGVGDASSSSSSSTGPLVSGSWLPLDACGVPVGATSNGRFPDVAGYASSAAAGSELVAGLAGTAAAGAAAGPSSSKKGAAAAGAGASAAAAVGRSSASNRVPLCGWDLVRAVGGVAHPVAACLKGRTDATALRDLPSLVLEVSVSLCDECDAG